MLSDFSLTTCIKDGDCMEMSKALSAGFSMYNLGCNLYVNLDPGLRAWACSVWGLWFRPESAEQILFGVFFRFILRIWHPDHIPSMPMESSTKSPLRAVFMMMNLLLGLRKMVKLSQITATYTYGMQAGARAPCSQEQLVGPGSTTPI